MQHYDVVYLNQAIFIYLIYLIYTLPFNLSKLIQPILAFTHEQNTQQTFLKQHNNGDAEDEI